MTSFRNDSNAARPNTRATRRPLGERLSYCVPTGLLVALMTMGGLGDALLSDEAVVMMRQLGYPDYFTALLGVAKLLGVVAVLAPVPRVLREWAYAGFTFDVIGAAVSIACTGDSLLGASAPLIALAFILWSRRGWLKRLEQREPRTAETHATAMFAVPAE